MLRKLTFAFLLCGSAFALAHDSNGVTIKIVHGETSTAISVSGQTKLLQGKSTQKFVQTHLKATLNQKPWEIPQGELIEDQEAKRFIWQTEIPIQNPNFEITGTMTNGKEDIPTTIQEYEKGQLANSYSYRILHSHPPVSDPKSAKNRNPAEPLFLSATIGLIAFGIHRYITLRKAAPMSSANHP